MKNIKLEEAAIDSSHSKIRSRLRITAYINKDAGRLAIGSIYAGFRRDTLNPCYVVSIGSKDDAYFSKFIDAYNYIQELAEDD